MKIMEGVKEEDQERMLLKEIEWLVNEQRFIPAFRLWERIEFTSCGNPDWSFELLKIIIFGLNISSILKPLWFDSSEQVS